MTELRDWQRRLSEHFSDLAATTSARSKRSVFALEHGLDPAELVDLQDSIRRAAKARTPGSDAPLPWIVYATELGYRYSGDEYWQTFEEETPGWSDYAERGWLRDQFAWFHKRFRGVKPVGAWAQHFSIISWPIANAILPKDLQVQLARILHGMAHKLNAELLNDPEELGAAIAARSWDTSPRFQNLSQQHLLLGQIATALLLQGEDSATSLILPTTLRRIASDLEREQQSKDWLRTARGIAIERLRARGVAGNLGNKREQQTRHEDDFNSIALQPRLALRPSFSKQNCWTVFLELPDLTPLLEIIPDSREALLSSRCVVAGADGRPLARGRVLQGLQRVALSNWPKSGEPLIAFEIECAQLKAVLHAHFSMPMNSVMLFRVASDGLAYEVKGAAVRAGQKYIVLKNRGNGTIVRGSTVTGIECEGVEAAVLQMPETLERHLIDSLKSAGLSVSKAIRVSPAGIGAINWDGEGQTEWLASERPCFALHSDHEIAAVEAIFRQQREQLGRLLPGETLFLAFPPLEPGDHQILLEARDGESTTATPVGRLAIHSRAARSWEPGRGPQGPLMFDVYPFHPTLEQLREGRVNLSIRGPVGRALECQVRLFQRGEAVPIFDKSLPNISLPVTPDAWNQYLEERLFGNREIAELYDSATVCAIQLSADELGVVSLRVERESVPVRWAIRKKGHARQITLVTDIAENQTVRVGTRRFDRPDIEESHDPALYRTWHETPKEGGLFHAQVGEFSSAVILPPQVQNLGDLRVNIRLLNRTRSLREAQSIFGIIEAWAMARPSGNMLSGTRQRGVLRNLTARLHSMIAGENWNKAENLPQDRPASVLMKAFSWRPEEYEIVKSVVAHLETLGADSSRRRVGWLYGKQSKPSTDRRVYQLTRLPEGTEKLTLVEGKPSSSDLYWLCEFALRLASDPGHLSAWAGDRLGEGMEKLWGRPKIVRLARFMVLALERLRVAGPQRSSAALYSGWDWA